MKVDPRFLQADGREIFTGNELLLKGALEVEGGVHLLGGYPGSPVAGFFDSIAQVQDLLNDKGVRAVINNNEALSAAMLNGSQVAGVRGLICMKSVGVHVAADALALGAQSGAHPDGGAVVVYGDDPWSDSTQVPADSRYISKHLFIPVVEPSNPQEVKDFVDLAFKVSAGSETYAGFILPNNLADGGGSVVCRPNQFPALNTHQRQMLDTAAIDTDKFVLLPPKTWWQEESMPARLTKAAKLATELGLNVIESPAKSRKCVGFVTSGLAHGYLQQALAELGLLTEFPILKFGLTYPLDEEMVAELSHQCERILVVEERRGFLEEQINQIVTKARQLGAEGGDVEVWGKVLPGGSEGFPITRGLHPSIVIAKLVAFFDAIGGIGSQVTIPASAETLHREMQTIDTTAKADVAPLPIRLATFCPGCPHRDSADLCLEIKKRCADPRYMRAKYDREPIDLMFHGDTGCYTMLMYPPNTPLMHDYSGMGLGGGTGSGVDPFVDNKQVVFMGDSTFFHSGQIAISQAIKLGQDITFIILDNRTTAMTGHQPTPGVDWDVVGGATPVQDIEDIVNGIAGDTQVPVRRTDPADRGPYGRMLESMFLRDGVKVVIADKECGIMRARRTRRAQRTEIRETGFIASREAMNINAEICRFCLACAEMTGCPGLKNVQTDYGPKMDTDLTACVNDGACQRIGACWSFERVTIRRNKPARTRVPELGLDDIPEPRKRHAGDMWHCYLAGVGGMGIGLATQILVRAGHKEGYHVAFVDKKGLAIRNGGVNSQVAFMKKPRPSTGLIPFGKADLLLGVDVLEAARAMDPTGRMRAASADRTAAVINTDKIPTILGVMGQEDFDVAELEKTIRAHTRSDDYLARNISRICQEYLGSKIYANIMMLGFAFQKGLIPVSMHSIAWAIKDTIRADFKKNLYAFNMGRKLMEDPNLFQGAPHPTGWKQTLEAQRRNIKRRYRSGKTLADAFEAMATDAVGKMADLDETLLRDFVVRLYDCLRWGGAPYAKRYARQVLAVHDRQADLTDKTTTRAVIHALARAMLIKDAVYVAELATSPEKYAHDRRKYDINPANGDSITYRHLLSTKLALGRWKWTFTVTTPPWALKLLKRAKFLRKLAPKWHANEKRFLARYEAYLADFTPSVSEEERQQALAALSSARCIDCMVPTCQELGCPLESTIPDWIDLAYHDRWQEAAEVLHAVNNFPEFTGTICPAPCQSVCKQNATDFPVQIRQIERQIVDHAFKGGWVTPQKTTNKTGRRIAVIGSGPAGLTVAQQLTRAGHTVTVFEKDDAPGGLLRRGIPDFRLDKAMVDRRVEQLRAEGVEFRTGVTVGADVTGAELREQFDAICLATGASAPRDLAVPGRGSRGIHFALDFLRQQNDRAASREIAGEPISADGKSVVVIGGGETGNDCIETALNQGAKTVHQIEILPESAVKVDLTHCRPENVKRHFSTATQAFTTDGDNLTGLTAKAVRWVHSATGPHMVESSDSAFTLDADMALLALGFAPAVTPDLAEQLGIDTDQSGRPTLKDNATTAPDVFAAGDLATGAALVVNAIATGRKTAEAIEKYLAQRPRI